MLDLISLTTAVMPLASSLLAALGATVLEQGREVAIEKGKDFVLAQGERGVRQLFRLDEKEQLRHLQQALKNATERSLAALETPADDAQRLAMRDQYKDILQTLSQPGPLGEALRHAMQSLFIFADIPDFAALSEVYNQRRRFYDATHQDIDAAPALRCFFMALEPELYADPYFRPQISDALHLRLSKEQLHSSQETHHTLLDVVAWLQKIDAQFETGYSAMDLARDMESYRAYVERTLHHLPMRGIVLQDRVADPELHGIFVPLRLHAREQGDDEDTAPDALIAALEQTPCLAVLGGPGSGKSTATKYLAWSHAAAKQHTELAPTLPLLSGSPLPLRIELRRLSEERKKANYDFLTFATEVTLKSDGLDIKLQMFKELLARRCLLLLFDGLDEVATLNERGQLVSEIEHFALCYPGNRVLVTSRPVGYEQAPLSHPLFAHATVQPFDDEQMQQFVKNWYTAVLRLSPLPADAQKEVDVLLNALRENPRLHTLAENPLLLTMMVALHRYERLPEKRVQVYDRCADLLLDSWARLRGTEKKWQDLEISKESQYACVASLGFILHERAQDMPDDEAVEQDVWVVKDEEDEVQSVDVTLHFLQRHIQGFLAKQELIVGKAKQQMQAQRFIELIQEEAGLLVERGTDTHGKLLYSFVHRTFQEYFAAVDVYERYLNATEQVEQILSEFLIRHLHDPHWREVILLLLSKLRPPHVTKLLQQLLRGELVTRRSRYTNIMQQDLFFVCDCLLEGITVQITLVSLVISRLCTVVKTAPFPVQQEEALKYLGKLTRSQQYHALSSKALRAFVTQEPEYLLESAMHMQAIKMLYVYSPASSDERQYALTTLQKWIHHPDLPVEQQWQTAASLYRSSASGSAEEQFATQMLLGLLHRKDLPVQDIRQTAASLYRSSASGSAEQLLATSRLLSLIARDDAPKNLGNDEVYHILRAVVSRFHELPESDDLVG